MAIFRYSRWDGTQTGFDLDADHILSEIKEDLMYHGDVGYALRRLLQQGFSDRDGRHIEGLQELLEQIRERRRQEREQHDLGGAYQEIANELNDIVDQEGRALDELEGDARTSGDERRREVTDEVVGERRAELGLLPEDLPRARARPHALRVHFERGQGTLRTTLGASAGGGGPVLPRPGGRGRRGDRSRGT